MTGTRFEQSMQLWGAALVCEHHYIYLIYICFFIDCHIWAIYMRSI